MGFIGESIREGARLLATDGGVWRIVWVSLYVSVVATAAAVVVGVPLGSLIALKQFRGKRLVIALVNTGMGLPPVVVGLVVSLLLFRNGPLGFLHWLYTVKGMICAQVIIATPVVTGLTLAAVQSAERRLFLQVLALGASSVQALCVVLKEIRLSVLAAVIAGFGSVISEVGAVMMVGGNIKGQTRVLTTAMVLETNMGRFETAIALGMILLAMSFMVNLALTFIQQRTTRG